MNPGPIRATIQSCLAAGTLLACSGPESPPVTGTPAMPTTAKALPATAPPTATAAPAPRTEPTETKKAAEPPAPTETPTPTATAPTEAPRHRSPQCRRGLRTSQRRHRSRRPRWRPRWNRHLYPHRNQYPYPRRPRRPTSRSSQPESHQYQWRITAEATTVWSATGEAARQRTGDPTSLSGCKKIPLSCWTSIRPRTSKRPSEWLTPTAPRRGWSRT